MAKSGIASVLGTEDRRFNSCCADTVIVVKEIMKRTLNELSDILDSGKMVTRQEMRNIMWDLREVAEALVKQHRNMNNKVNKVTAYYRHSNTPSRKAMVELCNRQIDVEQAVRKITGPIV